MATRLFDEEAQESRGESARMEAYVGAIAVGDLVKTTLGPHGMDKILLSATTPGKNTVTNDGATILTSLFLDNASAKVLVDISKTQDNEVGDGTTSVCVFAAEQLREAEKLVDKKVHPTTIIQGYRAAEQVALEALDAAAVDNSANEEAFHGDLFRIARTTLSSKQLTKNRDMFAHLVVDAVLRLKGSTDLDKIQIIKVAGGTLADSYLEEGFILQKKLGVGQPRRVENAKILIANTPMDTDKVKIFSAKVKVSSPKQVAELEKAEKDKMKRKCEKILAHNCNVFINRQLIYNYPEQLFTAAGCTSIEHADFEGVERLSAVTGGDIVSTFDNPEEVTLGECDLIEEIILGEEKMIRFSGCKEGAACTIVLRGATNHILDEAERSLHDALCVVSQTVKHPRTVLGAGASECLMAKAVDDLAAKTSGKKSLAIEAYARALRQMPAIIADNAGLDSMELVAQLRAEHYNGQQDTGIDVIKGTVANVRELGITEAHKSKSSIVRSATEAAEMILRVDDIIKCAPRRREGY